jgi:hypothetical protein
MYTAVLGLIFCTSLYPLAHAWRANRGTSLFQAVSWALASWILWGLALACGLLQLGSLLYLARYLALCLTGCAGVAVLGARRPGVGAWNFVVLGLLAVELLPLAEGALAGSGLQLGGFRVIFLAATLVVGILNYLPTRLAAGALLLGVGCGLEVAALVQADDLAQAPAAANRPAWFLLACAPWAAWAGLRWQPSPPSELDGLWLDFRDRYGFVWAQRVREQFNRSAANAGWPVVLRWQGLRLFRGTSLPEPAVQDALLATLRALLKRFGDEAPAPPA